MTALLLDLGNTALKWATSDKPEEPHAYVHCGNDVVPDELLHKWLNLKPERVVGCMVSSEKFAFNITRFSMRTASSGIGCILNVYSKAGVFSCQQVRQLRATR